MRWQDVPHVWREMKYVRKISVKKLQKKLGRPETESYSVVNKCKALV